ncbi:MAG: uroporphyrinogen decarboxylase [Beijerinckiaceae bacterium]|nr:uroporphyrinogen decarboxylase [Beijerinckiaceae bacterium]MCI0734970.1 uroporphyrinogen decarboxylase [Beijerinckiaceae bacterium]
MDGEPCFPPPVWLMRQAGRYLPEYRTLRAKSPSFLDFCYTPALAAEATLQPIRRFGFDAAILFSDILVIPDALGQKVSFEENGGPKLDPIVTQEDFARLNGEIDRSRLSPVFEAIERVKASLPAEAALLGFCGAPWTLACYMVAGKGSLDQAPARIFAYRQRDQFQRLIRRLVQASIDYLSLQIEAGVDAVQIFDTWAGVLPPAEFEHWCQEPVAAIVSGLRLRHKDARIICFLKGTGQKLMDFAERAGADAIGLDSSVDPRWAVKAFNRDLVLQGNLDPVVLAAGGPALETSVRDILSVFRRRRHIFNLGHGILPHTPISHVELMLDLIRAGSAS